MTPFYRKRLEYCPRFPAILKDIKAVKTVPKQKVEPKVSDSEKVTLRKIFPHNYALPVLNFEHQDGKKIKLKTQRLGVVLSGGQAPGGHNVIAGIFDALAQLDNASVLLGFRSGPNGILKNDYFEIDGPTVDRYRNSGGFDLLGSGRTKIETPEQFARCAEVFTDNKLDAFIIIGGDDSNTNAALLSEYLRAKKHPTTIIGIPKTIDGDLKNDFVETSFGFDTAVRLYSELISNIARDAISAKKYYHFIRLMGRSASHITLEAALQTHPNVVLISEEIAAQKKTVYEIVEDIAQIIVARATAGKNYGVILVPEGIIEFIPEINILIAELNDVMAEHRDYMATLKSFTDITEYLTHKLSKESAYTLFGLPIGIQRQLLMERDPHGNVQVSLVETEKLLIELLTARLAELKVEGGYKGKFGYQTHFLGYEGRCAAPTNFDADYAFALGLTAVVLSLAKASGYMSVVKNLVAARENWLPMGVPLVAMMNMERRHASIKPVIKKSLVDIAGCVFNRFAQKRAAWAMQDEYRFVGAIQYFGPPEICDLVPKMLTIEANANTNDVGSSADILC